MPALSPRRRAAPLKKGLFIMSEWKPGYFQTYPQAIRGIFVGLLAAIVYGSIIVWLLGHPMAALRVYAGVGAATFGFVALSSQWSRRSRWASTCLAIAMFAIALRSFWI